MVSKELQELAEKPSKKRKKTRKPVKDALVRLKNKLKKSKDIKVLITSISSILIYGLTLGLGLTLFGIDLSILSILGSGCLAYIFEIKLLDMLIRLISSVKIIQLHK